LVGDDEGDVERDGVWCVALSVQVLLIEEIGMERTGVSIV
jgi:hypothetical protein